MLVEVDSKTYNRFFPSNPHPFLSEPFVELNTGKAERIIRLVENIEKPGVGIVAGIKNNVIHSPFSAPFGGFHFRKEILYVSEIDNFLSSLKEFINSRNLHGMVITIPPDIYHETFNAKTVNALVRSGYRLSLPEITSWIDLNQFQGRFTQKNSKEYYRQALRNGLTFEIASDLNEKQEIYDLISENRARYGRPIFMTLHDIILTSRLWPVDYFKVLSGEGKIVASAIFYRSHPEIAYALFWGDNEFGRPLRAMDYLAFNLWSYYKELKYSYIDLGISTEAGIPNEGLLRFKESHESISSIRYSFSWETTMDQEINSKH